MKWGLFGGTFDPIHVGHLRCAEEVREIFDLDRIIFIPAARQPLKTDQDITPSADRARMIELAIHGNPAFALSDLEQQRGGTSYSIDTVKYFLANSPADLELYFILGQDAFRDIQQWKDWQELLKRCHFIVMTRPGYEADELPAIITEEIAKTYNYDNVSDGFTGPTKTSIYFRRLTFLEISSTDIRTRLSQQQSIRYLVPEAVYEYISTRELYGTL
jgi:nicotinate-nucleotide adenylyltransferase